MYHRSNLINLKEVLGYVPTAVSFVRGNEDYRGVNGTVKFFQTPKGVVVFAEISGLPISGEKCGNEIFAFHIHSGASCTGNTDDAFADVGTHYNPTDCPHPYHAGDMPPLFSSSGMALLAFLTDRFDAAEIIGKTVIIHDSPDDFTTQPSGNAGKKIACGEIVGVWR